MAGAQHCADGGVKDIYNRLLIESSLADISECAWCPLHGEGVEDGDKERGVASILPVVWKDVDGPRDTMAAPAKVEWHMEPDTSRPGRFYVFVASHRLEHSLEPHDISRLWSKSN